MKREIFITPAYDKRNSDPKQDYGIGGITLNFFVKGRIGVIHGYVLTCLHLNPEHNRGYLTSGGVCFHSLTLTSEEDTYNEKCQHTGKHCYHVDLGIIYWELDKLLVEKGSDGIFEKLEEAYQEQEKLYDETLRNRIPD